MSKHGNGNGTRNGNGTPGKVWNLTEDGMLWKTVLDYATEEFQEQAKAFVAQLQESVQPADALQGLLLDRIAAGHLRKQLMLEAEAAAGETLKAIKTKELSGRCSPEETRTTVVAMSLPLQSLWTGNALRYEALLDQALHRDLILLQQLKKVAATATAPPLGPTTPQRSTRGLIEADAAHLDVG
jgi:hypothetical protein